MQTLHTEIFIQAPRDKVWDVMLGDATYREWTNAFHPGSYYVGDWSEGSKMLFLGPDAEAGKEGGMVSRIKENRRPEFISIEHIGMVKDGVEDTTGEEVKKWVPAFENYTFTEQDGGTLLAVDMQAEASEYKEMFEQMWPKALQALKEIAEK